MPTRLERQQDRNWSTSNLTGSGRMGRWNDIVAANMAEMHVTAAQSHPFQANWQQVCLGPIDVNVLSTTPQIVRRTPEMVRNCSEATFELVYMQRGDMIVREGHREDLIREGDFGLLRNAVPYEFECSSHNIALSTHMPEAWLKSWLAHPETLRDVPWENRSAWGRPLAELLRLISDQGLQDSIIPRSVIADQIGGLLSLIGRHAGSGPAHRKSTLERLLGKLDERFREPDLTPAELARDAGISLRHLHGLFAAAGSTFGAELVERRLQYAAVKLRTLSADHPVSDVAYDAGFADPSHFARRFRQHFGSSPTRWRKEAG